MKSLTRLLTQSMQAVAKIAKALDIPMEELVACSYAKGYKTCRMGLAHLCCR